MIRFLFPIAALQAIACYGQLAGTAVISGTVVEASGSEPVLKAIVTLTLLEATPRTWATSRTDASGAFKFEKLPAGKYDLRASKARNGSAIYGVTDPKDLPKIIPLSEGESRDGLTLLFVHSGTIAGRVVDSEGDPLPGVSLTLLHASRSPEGRTVLDYAATNDRGEYRIINVGVGRYFLRASPGDGQNSTGETLGTQYYGGAEDWSDATVLKVHSAENLTGLDIHLRLTQALSVRGHVVGVPAEQPVTVNVSPALDGEATWSYDLAANPPDYLFDFGNIEGGKYIVESRASQGNRKWTGVQAIDSRRPLSDIVLNLVPSADVKGELKVEGHSTPLPTTVQITLERKAWSTENVSGHPDSTGKFIIPQVSPGEWAMNISTPAPGAFLKSVRKGDRDLLFNHIPVESDSDAPLTVVVSTDAAMIQGAVDLGVGPEDAQHAGIVLAPLGVYHSVERLYYGVAADSAGKFHMENLRPGKYKIFALEKFAPGAFCNPEAADQLDPLGQEIELTEGATFEAHPKLIANAKVRESVQ